jgi:recombination protein RecT
MSEVTNAVARRNEAEQIIQQYTPDFAQVLPSHVKPETFVRLSQGIIRRDPKLGEIARKNPGSFLAALLDCARLGHEPGTEQYYLVPFGNEIVGIEGYRGIVERIYRAGAVASVICEVVRQGEQFTYRRGVDKVPVHETDWDAEEQGDLRLAYAYGVMKDGAISRVVVMGKAEIMKHKAESKTSHRADSLWNKWESSAWLKTVARELEKWVPSSSEFRREQLRAVAEADNLRRSAQAPQPKTTVSLPDEVVDAEIVESNGPGPNPGQQAGEWPPVAQPGGGE